MNKIKIPVEEFKQCIENIKKLMKEQNLDAIFIYGDEHRKENLRYVSNFWPIFERGGLLLGLHTDPIVVYAPEGQKVAEEMAVWPDIRLVPEFACVTVSDTIDFPHANYTSFKKLFDKLSANDNIKRFGIVGIDAMSADLFDKIKASFPCEVVDANNILFKLRLTKTKNEIACLREAARIADCGVKAVLDSNIIGITEIEAAGIAEYAARKAGAEHVIFMLFSSGDRTHTIVGRPSHKIIEDGDMIQCGLAIQHEGYVATCELPFAVGNISEETKRVIDVLFNAYEKGTAMIKPGNKMKDMVRAVRDYFREVNLSEYDVYPPLHGIGCAEAESPYPDENTETMFEPGMVTNTDISLFGLPGGSNRVEAGFVVTKTGAEPCLHWLTSVAESGLESNISKEKVEVLRLSL